MGMTYNIVNIQDGTATYVHQSEDDIVTSSVKVIILSLQVQINLSFKMY